MATNSVNLAARSVNMDQHFNSKDTNSRLYFIGMLARTILFTPITRTLTLAYHTVKLLTWVPGKAALYAISGFRTESAAYLEHEYLKTVKAFRDVIYLPSITWRIILDIATTRQDIPDDLPCKAPNQYLNVNCTASFPQYSSYLHGVGTFEVKKPNDITEFPATTDGSLNTVMASNIFKSDVLAINFGCPNVATFMTKEVDGKVQTIKVDAKSLKREEMKYHETNGKIQSGIFLVPTNLPPEALERFNDAAKAMIGRKDITCVNTNCRILEQAGFSIEGVAMDGVVFPTTLLEHLLFRKVIYTDKDGNKHRVHFDVINTTKYDLETYMQTVDTAVVGTRLRHARRNNDTPENQAARGEEAKRIIAEEKARLESASIDDDFDIDESSPRRKATISVPSFIGNAIARFWGRHTIYELDLSDKKDQIHQAFVNTVPAGTALMLRPFPQEKVNLSTRLKRDIFFSGPMVRFLRRHMMGQEDTLFLHTRDLFKHLQSTNGEHLNYVLLGDKVVVARVKSNTKDEAHRNVADWALSKHALLAGRQDVYCSGEMWYDKQAKCFVMNCDSGTYKPDDQRVMVAAKLAETIFGGSFKVELQKGE